MRILERLFSVSLLFVAIFVFFEIFALSRLRSEQAEADAIFLGNSIGQYLEIEDFEAISLLLFEERPLLVAWELWYFDTEEGFPERLFRHESSENQRHTLPYIERRFEWFGDEQNEDQEVFLVFEYRLLNLRDVLYSFYWFSLVMLIFLVIYVVASFIYYRIF